MITEETRAYRKTWREAHREQKRAYHLGLIRKAMKIYGSKCQDCGNLDMIVLEFHHPNGQRGKKKEQTVTVALKVIKANNISPDYMLLCANCHKHHDLEDSTSRRKEAEAMRYWLLR